MKKLKKSQLHNQKMFPVFCENILTKGCGTFEDLAKALDKAGIKNYYGKPYTVNNLYQLKHQWNKVSKDEDFRQDYIEEFLPDKPSIYSNDSEPDDVLSEVRTDAEQFKFIEEHRKGENFSEKKKRETQDKFLEKLSKREEFEPIVRVFLRNSKNRV